MAEFFLALFIFVAVMAVTALIFGGWIIVSVFRGLGVLLGLSTHQPSNPDRRNAPLPPIPMAQQRGGPPGAIQCRMPGCRHPNPEGAKFCRHCGHAFPQAQHVSARRPAMA